MAIPPGNGINQAQKKYPLLKKDIHSLKTKIIDRALELQMLRNSKSKTLTGVQELALEFLTIKNDKYKDLTPPEISNVGRIVSSFWANTYKASVAEQWYKKLPNIYEFYVPQSTQQSLQEEFDMIDCQVKQEEEHVAQSDMWTVKCYNPKGECVTTKMMTAEEIIYQFIKWERLRLLYLKSYR